MLGEMDEQVILGNFVDELYYKQCNHEESDINKSPLLMSKSTSDMYHEEYDRMRQRFRIQISNFNPRTHEGYDIEDPHAFTKSFVISIHVPTKGTTTTAQEAQKTQRISIHVPTKGTTFTYRRECRSK